MQPDYQPALRIAGAGRVALRQTATWALVAAGLWLAGLIGGGIWTIFFFGRDMPPDLAPLARNGMYAVAFAAWAFDALFVAAFATFAIQYGRRLGMALRRADPGALEAAFYAQRRFWTLGGACVIAVIALSVLAMVAAIAIPLVLVGLQHAG